MSRFTRRLFLQRASLGAAAVGGVLALPRAAGAAAHSLPQSSSALSSPNTAAPAQAEIVAAGDPVVAYVRNPSAGEISLFVGTREVRLRDPDLAQRLIQAGA